MRKLFLFIVLTIFIISIYSQEKPYISSYICNGGIYATGDSVNVSIRVENFNNYDSYKVCYSIINDTLSMPTINIQVVNDEFISDEDIYQPPHSISSRKDLFHSFIVPDIPNGKYYISSYILNSTDNDTISRKFIAVKKYPKFVDYELEYIDPEIFFHYSLPLNSSVTIYYLIKNNGYGQVKIPTVRYYASNDSIVDSSDLLIDSSISGNTFLHCREYVKIRGKFDLKSDVTGYKFLIVDIAEASTLGDTVRSNNNFVVSFPWEIFSYKVSELSNSIIFKFMPSPSSTWWYNRV